MVPMKRITPSRPIILTQKRDLIPFQIVPTLPDTFTDDGWASGIVSAPGGRFVYVSNRKADLVSVFAADPATGKLSLVQWIPTKANSPASSVWYLMGLCSLRPMNWARLSVSLMSIPKRAASMMVNMSLRRIVPFA